ncbi:hypothetical protein GBA52_004603 [Prunus armeniaca]|nr:hypothetical protein GBA52_004603 [Prunus armeniaca]
MRTLLALCVAFSLIFASLQADAKSSSNKIPYMKLWKGNSNLGASRINFFRGIHLLPNIKKLASRINLLCGVDLPPTCELSHGA